MWFEEFLKKGGAVTLKAPSLNNTELESRNLDPTREENTPRLD